MTILEFWLSDHLTPADGRFIFAMTAVQLAVTKQGGWQACREIFTQEGKMLWSRFTLSIWQIWKIYKTNTGCQHMRSWPRTSSFNNNLLFPSSSASFHCSFLHYFFSSFLSFSFPILQNSLGLLSLHFLQYYWHWGKQVCTHSCLRRNQRWLWGSQQGCALARALPWIGSM